MARHNNDGKRAGEATRRPVLHHHRKPEATNDDSVVGDGSVGAQMLRDDDRQKRGKRRCVRDGRGRVERHAMARVLAHPSVPSDGKGRECERE